jgi:large subunit ribosomal protein L23
MELHDVLIRPIITEKSNALMAEQNKYTFRVHPKATKPEIRRAVEAIFKVPVVEVRTMNVRGKLRRQGRTMGYQPAWKKAIVTVAEGKSIQFFEGV